MITVRIDDVEMGQRVKYFSFQRNQIDKLAVLKNIPADIVWEIKVASLVFPLRVNRYLIDELINWQNVPADPMFRLLFPLKGMLQSADFDQLSTLLKNQRPVTEIDTLVAKIRGSLNPHPSGQTTKNKPQYQQQDMQGFQHKYRETLLFFPSQAQYCHAYCTYCFRWAQFTGKQTRMSSNDGELLGAYLADHQEITDVLITGGDPMVMRASKLRSYLSVLSSPTSQHVKNIRIGTKSLAFWPARFVHDDDTQALLMAIRDTVDHQKHVSIMAHFSHPVELTSPTVRTAIHNLLAAGAQIRTQAPLIRGINDDADIWVELWTTQVQLGLTPYYMFIERDTGPRHYFEVSLVRAFEIFRDAYSRVSGLCKTVRGPVMSADAGKIEITGITEIYGERVFCLQFIQARNPDWIKQPFFAQFDATATWISDLRPAFGQARFFWQ